MEVSQDHHFVIYYASQTGTAENFATILKKEAQSHHLIARIINLADLTQAQFLEYKNSIFIMATHYEGDPPDNAVEFWSWFSNESKWGSEYLHGHKFTCFALGDTNYLDTFARIGQ